MNMDADVKTTSSGEGFEIIPLFEDDTRGLLWLRLRGFNLCPVWPSKIVGNRGIFCDVLARPCKTGSNSKKNLPGTDAGVVKQRAQTAA